MPSLQTPSLEHYTTYTEGDILPCVYKMAKLVQNMGTSKQQAVKTKYAAEQYMKISRTQGLFSATVKSLAAKC